jgi:ABC-type transporter Mla MlaB component
MTMNERARWAARVALPPAPPETTGPWPGSRALMLVLSGTIGPADVAPLCERVADLLSGSQAMLIVCDVGELAAPGLAAVDALARLQLAAHRGGRRIRLWRVRPDLRALLELSGLSQVLPIAADSPPGVCGQGREGPGA